MFLRGLYILFKILIVPIFMITLGWALHYYGNLDLISSANASMAITCFLIIMWMLISHTLIKSKLDELTNGLNAYETSITKRINNISANMGKKSNVEELEKQIEFLKYKIDEDDRPNKVINSETSLQEPAILLDNKKQISKANLLQGDEAKVISINAAKRPLKNKNNQDKLHYTNAAIIRLIEAGNLCIYLQPKVTLIDNSVYGFEVLARLKDDHDHIIPACQFMGAITKPNMLQELDAQVIDKAFMLIRSLRRNDQDHILHVNLSIHTLANKSAFEKLHKKLQANKALRTRLVLEMNEKEFSKINSKHTNAISKIMKTGFRFCIDQCEDINGAINYMKSGIISAIKINANTFHELDYWSTLDGGMNITSQARANGVKLIVTHVEKKRQILQLIDNDVELAQGFLFSEPKPPLGERKEKHETSKEVKSLKR